VPAVRFNTHLHGSHVEDIYDGNPYAHRVPGDPPAPPDQDPAAPFEITTNQGRTMQYVNDQEAGLLFYHDHGLGITRSNVYAAAAGAYVIVDPAHSLGTPDDPVGIPLVIQDKLFAGSALSYPTGPNSWVPEFVGDVSLVNGKAWPFMNTQPRWYRFRLLNASNSRIYSLRLFPARTLPTRFPSCRSATSSASSPHR